MRGSSPAFPFFSQSNVIGKIITYSYVMPRGCITSECRTKTHSDIRFDLQVILVNMLCKHGNGQSALYDATRRQIEKFAQKYAYLMKTGRTTYNVLSICHVLFYLLFYLGENLNSRV